MLLTNQLSRNNQNSKFLSKTNIAIRHPFTNLEKEGAKLGKFYI